MKIVAERTARKRQSFVYVLMHRDGTRFKIGKALEIRARKQTLGAERFQALGSFALRFASDTRALEAESILHRLFAVSQCDAMAVERADGIAIGSTEFFHIDVYDRVVHFVESHLDLLQASLVDDMTPFFATLRALEMGPRSVDPAAKRARQLAEAIEREREREDLIERQLQSCQDTIDGPLRGAMEALAVLCSISVRGQCALFVGRLRDRHEIDAQVESLAKATLRVAGAKSAVRLVGSQTSYDDDYRRRRIHVLALEFLDGRGDGVELGLKQRLTDVFHAARKPVMAATDQSYHARCWAAEVARESASFAQTIRRYERAGSKDVPAMEACANAYFGLTPDFGAEGPATA